VSRRRTLRLPAFAKVNLALEVLGPREDGYHELRTLFQSVALADEIVLRLRPGPAAVRCDDPRVPTGPDNLALRAALDLARFAKREPAVEIRIGKRIPVAGGLGGGSSDAAAVLLGLDALWRLGLGRQGLQPLARRLGADVPYFLFGGTALGLGRGDEVYPLERQLYAQIVIVDPGVPLATRAVFARHARKLTPRENSTNIHRFISSKDGGAASVRGLVNELEMAALEEAPELAARLRRIRETLREGGAGHVALSGSGSSYFGVFERAAGAEAARRRLTAAGFSAWRGRTLRAPQYRAAWSRALGEAGAS
jgi:4-diphosphocytidyl-2-C-methyl-D-erythritol kinase